MEMEVMIDVKDTDKLVRRMNVSSKHGKKVLAAVLLVYQSSHHCLGWIVRWWLNSLIISKQTQIARSMDLKSRNAS